MTYPDEMFEEAERREAERKVLDALDKLYEENGDALKRLAKHNNRPPSLWNVMRFQLGFSIDMSDEIVDAVEKWLPKEHDTNSYEWNKCVRMLREKLWEQSE